MQSGQAKHHKIVEITLARGCASRDVVVLLAKFALYPAFALEKGHLFVFASSANIALGAGSTLVIAV